MIARQRLHQAGEAAQVVRPRQHEIDRHAHAGVLLEIPDRLVELRAAIGQAVRRQRRGSRQPVHRNGEDDTVGRPLGPRAAQEGQQVLPAFGPVRRVQQHRIDLDDRPLARERDAIAMRRDRVVLGVARIGRVERIRQALRIGFRRPEHHEPRHRIGMLVHQVGAEQLLGRRLHVGRRLPPLRRCRVGRDGLLRGSRGAGRACRARRRRRRRLLPVLARDIENRQHHDGARRQSEHDRDVRQVRRQRSQGR